MSTPIERAAKALYNSAQPPSHDTEAHMVFASIDVLDLVDVIEGAHTDHPSCALEPVDIANAIIAYLTGDNR